MIFFPFFVNCTRTALRTAELGCLAETPILATTIPAAMHAPYSGLALREARQCIFLYCLSAQRLTRAPLRNLRAAFIPDVLAIRRSGKMD